MGDLSDAVPLLPEFSVNLEPPKSCFPSLIQFNNSSVLLYGKKMEVS